MVKHILFDLKIEKYQEKYESKETGCMGEKPYGV